MRKRDPRKLLPTSRPLPAAVKIVHVPEQGYRDDGSVTTRQKAELTLPRDALERLWTVENLENLARTYWAFLIRVSHGLLKIRYSSDSREIVALGFIVLLRFHRPDYEANSCRGCVTWRINKGFLVAPGGRNKGHLRICVERPQHVNGDDEVTVTVSSEVGAFVPMLTFPGLRSLSGFGRWLYRQTQLRIHVIVTHAFLRSLGNLELEQSQVGALRLVPAPQPPQPIA
ncbi:MAG TPA: hypothetical protein VE570_15080 [Thermoleophilaceae bacterium]|jgi:hypothetical protein|nr:hypothetical protein [Thermoleophilaceae bacterium]